MSRLTLADHQAFAAAWIEYVERRRNTVAHFAHSQGLCEREAYMKRDKAQRALGIVLRSANQHVTFKPVLDNVTLEGEYHALVASDWHIWPGYTSRAEEVFYQTLQADKFDMVVLNGDVTDQPRVSRHDPIQGIQPPSLVDELTEAQSRVAHVAKLARKKNKACKLIWTMGNHDSRAWRHTALLAPEIAPMFDFEALFPDWQFTMSITVNDNCVIKHRWNKGLHAALNNTRNSGTTLVTGHTHRLLVTPWTDYNGTRYGIETGTLCDPRGPQFQYIENDPVNWQPGFIELFLDADDVHAERIDCSRKTIRRLGKPVNG